MAQSPSELLAFASREQDRMVLKAPIVLDSHASGPLSAVRSSLRRGSKTHAIAAAILLHVARQLAPPYPGLCGLRGRRRRPPLRRWHILSEQGNSFARHPIWALLLLQRRLRGVASYRKSFFAI